MKRTLPLHSLSSTAIEAGEEEEDLEHHGGSYHTYFAQKTHKVRQQFEFEREALHSTNSAILSGVVAYVNGFTNPPPDDLRLLVIQNGGRAETFDGRHMTHIICEQVPDTKAKALLKKRDTGNKLWVRPAWVLDSVAAGRRLQERLYLPSGLEKTDGENIARSFAINRPIVQNASPFLHQRREDISLEGDEIASGIDSRLPVPRSANPARSMWIGVEAIDLMAHAALQENGVDVQDGEFAVAVVDLNVHDDTHCNERVESCNELARRVGVSNWMSANNAGALGALIIPLSISQRRATAEKVLSSLLPWTRGKPPGSVIALNASTLIMEISEYGDDDESFERRALVTANEMAKALEDAFGCHVRVGHGQYPEEATEQLEQTTGVAAAAVPSSPPILMPPPKGKGRAKDSSLQPSRQNEAPLDEIESLPSMSQVDPEFLEALPVDLRDSISRDIARCAASREQRLSEASPLALHAQPLTEGGATMTLSQVGLAVDPGVLAALGPEMAREALLEARRHQQREPGRNQSGVNHHVLRREDQLPPQPLTRSKRSSPRKGLGGMSRGPQLSLQESLKLASIRKVFDMDGWTLAQKKDAVRQALPGFNFQAHVRSSHSSPPRPDFTREGPGRLSSPLLEAEPEAHIKEDEKDHRCVPIFEAEGWSTCGAALEIWLRSEQVTWSRALLLSDFIITLVDGRRLDVAVRSLKAVRRVARRGGCSADAYRSIVEAAQERVRAVVGPACFLAGLEL